MHQYRVFVVVATDSRIEKFRKISETFSVQVRVYEHRLNWSNKDIGRRERLIFGCNASDIGPLDIQSAWERSPAVIPSTVSNSRDLPCNVPL
jgi:hypothetical protein